MRPDAFPLGRLHNLVIAPKRSGDRSRSGSAPSTTVTIDGKMSFAQTATRVNGKESRTPRDIGGPIRPDLISSSMRWIPVPVEAGDAQLPPGSKAAAAVAAATAETAGTTPKGEVLWEDDDGRKR